MRQDWQISSLEEIVKFIDYRGKTPQKTEYGMRLITAKNVKMGYLQNKPMEFVDPKIYDEWMTRGIPKKGDVLFTTEAPLGNVAQLDTDEKVVFAQRIIVMQPKREVLDSTFLKYMLLSNVMQEKIHEKGTGATVKGIKSQLLKKVKIYFPRSLSEQKQIVAILDEVFEVIDRAIANTEKNLANTRELFESYLNAIFIHKNERGEILKLANICEKERVITYGVIKLGEHIDDGVPCLRTSNVRWLNIDLNGIKRISPSLSADYKRTLLKGGEVLVNVRGTLGGVAVTTSKMAGWNISREVALIPIDIKRVYPAYVAYWIGARTNQQWLTGVQKGAAYTGINLEDLRNLPVVVPALKEQERLINSIEKVQSFSQRLETIYLQKLAALKELKQSILQKAFTGELTADTPKTIKEKIAA